MISSLESKGGASKILIVDDEEDIVTYLAAVLEDNGFIAVGESDPAAALEAVQREHPDLILLDIMMPGQSGLSLYRAIRRNPATAEIPVFIISGYSRGEDLAQTVSRLEMQGARLPEGYLEKPIAIPALLQNLHERLETRENEASRA